MVQNLCLHFCLLSSAEPPATTSLCFITGVINFNAEEQQEILETKDKGIERKILNSLPKLGGLSLIVSGIRRCGKSTLMQQLMQQQKYPNLLFLNFENSKLYDFDYSDFDRLSEIISRNYQ